MCITSFFAHAMRYTVNTIRMPRKVIKQETTAVDVKLLEKLSKNPKQVVKIVVLVVVGILILSVALSLMGKSFNSVRTVLNTRGVAESPALYYADEFSMGKASDGTGGALSPSMSDDVSIIVPPRGGYIEGNDAEDFEVTEYNASIETNDLAYTCAVLFNLKARSYVVFENAYEYDRGCSYTFKVAQEEVWEVLELIEGLDPKELSENSYTIKRQIENVVSEVEILEKKLASIQETLDIAVDAYDEITTIAIRSGNADNLAKIIEGRIQIIERLTNERLNVASQLDRYQKEKLRQLDRLGYTNFTVTVFENVYFDKERLIDSWKSALRTFVFDVNRIFQGITINFLTLLLSLLQWILYLLVLLFVAKYGWHFARNIWRR
jgi:hypothetical protein